MESWEWLAIDLTSPVAATLAAPSGYRYIKDDDAGPAGLVLGSGTSSGSNGGWGFVRGGAGDGYVETKRFQIPWQAYLDSGGDLRPALGDVDGDGLDEVVVGLGPGGGGWLAVFDDGAANHAFLGWVRVDWTAYNGANGETWPAVADLDADGKAEIVIGLGPGGGGTLQVLKDATQNFAHRNWIHLDWPTYNSANGSTHPAIGNLDADARPELVVGFWSGRERVSARARR